MKRIAVVCPDFYRRGGIERVAIAATNALSKTNQSTCAIGHYFEPSALDKSVETFTVPRSRLGGTGTVLRFGKQVQQTLVSLAESRAVDGVLGFGVVCPNDSVTWVQSVHAKWLETSQNQAFRGTLKRRLNPFHIAAIEREKHLFQGRRYRKLLALTDDVACDLQRFYRVPESDITVIPNGVCPTEFKPVEDKTKRDLRLEFGLQPDQPTVCFVANESDRKGLPQLFEAVARSQHKNIQLLLAGRLDGVADQLARQYGLSDRTRWVGQLEAIAPVFHAADAFVLPTRYEAWGLVIVEALACGIPVVTTRNAGAAQAIAPDVNGLLIEHANDISALTNAIDQILFEFKRSSQKIAESAEPYYWNAIIGRVAKVLDQAYSERPWNCGDLS